MNKHSKNNTNNTPDNELNDLFSAMKPRFISARRLYVRQRLVALMALPIIFGAGLAWASVDQTPEVSQLANGGDAIEEPAPVDDSEPEVEQDEEADGVEAGEDEVDQPETDQSEGAELVWTWVELGFAGKVNVAATNAGPVIGELQLNEGWEADVLELGWLKSVTLVLTNGEISLLATIEAEHETDSGESGFHVEVDDITPEPEPDYVTRKEIEVGDVGVVVVERDGDKLWLGVLSNHEWWKPVVVKEHGERVSAYFSNDGIKVHVEAWIDELEIAHKVWRVEPEDKPKDKEEDKEKDHEDDEVQNRKEIAVGEVGRVVVERDGEKLWLGVLWSHQWWDEVVVTANGAKVHAYFTNDGFEHHVKAWIKGNKIKHKTWVVEPELEAYDGSVNCGFGSVGILVEGNVARIVSVQSVEGVEADIVKEVGEVVKVRFTTSEAVWIMEAWGNGEAVVSECGQVE